MRSWFRDIALVFMGLVVISMMSCAPLKDNQNTAPDPAPDHGPDMNITDCVEPFLILEIVVLSDDDPAYAPRTIHVTVTGVSADGTPVEFEDKKTGKTTQFAWAADRKTEPLRPYMACVEYEPYMAPFFDIGVVMVGKSGDWMRVEVFRDSAPDRNLCVDPLLGLDDYAEDTIQDDGGNIAVVNCLVPTAIS